MIIKHWPKHSWPRVLTSIFLTCKWLLHGNFPFNLFNNDSYYFVCVKKYYMESTMDLFGVALLYWDRKYCWQVFLYQKLVDFFNSLVDHLRDICVAVCASYHNIRAPITTYNWKSRRYHTHFLLLSNRLTEKMKMFWINWNKHNSW